ncbi:MAG: AIR synthase related protein, partial [Candidatus Dadabacteria bacterium]|nr:AIR synthase related protein [Candidatus Dadabacteria bacterium]
MLMVLEKGKEEIAEKIFKKWGLDFSVIGEVTDTGKLIIAEEGKTVAEIPISLISEEAPIYDRPFSEPAYIKETRSSDLSSIPVPKDMNRVFLKLLSSPTLSDKRWIWEQYDYMVRTNTVVLPGSDAAVVRIKDTKKALAMTVNCNSTYCYLDPYTGGAIAVAESARNLACSGALPLAITDCLNFGSPEEPGVMWQFKRAIEGISEAAVRLNTPVVSGNVSFYNQTGRSAVYPTPTIGMVGLIADVEKHITQWFKDDGDVIVLLGETREELGGSEYMKQVHGIVAGVPPRLDLDAESNLVRALLEASDRGILKSAHDLSEGGIALSLAESCFTPENTVGITVELSGEIRGDALLFSESQARALVSLDDKNAGILRTITESNNVPMSVIGRVGGTGFLIKGLIDIPVSEARRAWAAGFESNLKSYAKA